MECNAGRDEEEASSLRLPNSSSRVSKNESAHEVSQLPLVRRPLFPFTPVHAVARDSERLPSRLSVSAYGKLSNSLCAALDSSFSFIHDRTVYQ